MMQIEQTLRYAKGAKHVIVAGDQQTFKAMLTLKKDSVNTEHSWFTPVPGDWHALVHWLMAIDRSWYSGYPAWAQAEAGISPFFETDFAVADFPVAKLFYQTSTITKN
jgi:hypothetical protein